MAHGHRTIFGCPHKPSMITAVAVLMPTPRPRPKPSDVGVLAGYAKFPLADEVAEELIKAWPRFPLAAYAQQVLASLDLSRRHLAVNSMEALQALAAAPNVRHVRLGTTVNNMHEISALRGLISLSAVATLRESVDGARHLTELRSLDLRHNRMIRDVSELARVTSLRELYLDGCTSLTDLSPLAELVGLRVLSAKHLTGIRDWGWLASLAETWTIAVDGSSLESLDPVAGMPNLRSLFADVPDGVKNLGRLSTCPRLRRLRIRLDATVADEIEFPPTLGWLELRGRVDESVLSKAAALTQLKTLKLEQTSKLFDSRLLGKFTNLAELSVHDVGTITDWSGLAPLTKLRRLDLSGCYVTDTSFAEGMSDLEVATFDRCRQLHNLGGLAASTALRRVSLNDSSGAVLGSEVDWLRENSQTREALEIEYDAFDLRDFGVS